MKAAVLVFPGSNCDRDLAVALELTMGRKPAMVWHGETSLPDDTDLVATGPDAEKWLTIAQAFAGPAGEGRSPRG